MLKPNVKQQQCRAGKCRMGCQHKFELVAITDNTMYRSTWEYICAYCDAYVMTDEHGKVLENDIPKIKVEDIHA